MPRTGIPFLFFLLLLTACPGVSADEPAAPAKNEPRKSQYFQQSGSQVDSLVDRIWFKICYSWEKAGEYYRLACSSTTDSFPARRRDAEARIAIKKDELIQQGTEKVKEAAGEAVRGLSEKGRELRDDLGKMGGEVKAETVKEIRENTDQMLK